MRMCRHWIWIGRRDCESSVRTAIRMNGEQQATQHTPTLTARQGTPLHNQHPTTQATTYAETGRRAAGFCGRRKPRHRPRLQQRHIPRKPQPLGRGGCEQPRCARGNPKAAAAGGNEDDEGGPREVRSEGSGPRSWARAAATPARGRPTKRQHTTLNEAPAAAAKAVAAVKTTASQTANTPAPKRPKTAPQRRRLLKTQTLNASA